MPETLRIEQEPREPSSDLTNPSNFSTKAEMTKPVLYAIALRRTRCPADAEDAVQETLLKAWKMIATFRGEALFSTWLTRILINEIHQLQRRRNYRDLEFQASLRMPELIAIERGHLVPFPSPEQALLRSDAKRQLHHAIGRLPKAFRQVLQLEINEERTCVEMATELSLSLPAVKSRRIRARTELMKRMAAVSA